jgi:coenzyme F420-reducing hydrogenase delta subunit
MIPMPAPVLQRDAGRSGSRYGTSAMEFSEPVRLVRLKIARSVLPEFLLRAFRNPSGADFARLGER